MVVHLVDGTYELFRHFYAMPSAKNAAGEEVAAVRGVMYSIRGLVQEGATHIGVATDHVIESFRNHLYAGYKTGEGIAPDLRAQFPLLEEGLEAWGLKVWPMVEFEADDALAAAAVKAADDPRVEQVIICTPDKDLAQCVRVTPASAPFGTQALVRAPPRFVDSPGIDWGIRPVRGTGTRRDARRSTL